MDWITPEIAIGNLEDAMDVAALRAAGIRSVLALHDFPNLAHSGLEWRQVVLYDGAGNPPERITRAVAQLEELATRHPKVLVHCSEGKSRSAAIIALYLMSAEGLSLEEACVRIARARPQMAIEPGLLAGVPGRSPVAHEGAGERG